MEPTSRSGVATVVDRLNDLWWSRLPRQAARLPGPLKQWLPDGSHLRRWPIAGAMSPLVAILTGLYLGKVHAPDYSTSALHYLYSPITVIVLILISGNGAALGVGLLAGFAVGDVWHYAYVPHGNFGRLLAARLLADGVLAVLLVSIPVNSRRLAAGAAATLASWIRLDPRAANGVRAVLQAFAAFLLVYLWLHTASLMLQSVYVWMGYNAMTHGLVQSLNAFAPLAALTAAYASGMRSALQQMGASSVQPRASGPPIGGWIVSSPLFAGIAGGVTRAAWATFLMASMVPTWSSAFSLFIKIAAIVVAFALVPRMLPRQLQQWSRIPQQWRVGGALFGAWVVAKYLTHAHPEDNTYAPAVQAALIGALVFVAALPRRSEAPATEPRSKLAPFAAAMLAIVLLPDDALAGYCTSLPNCFGDPGWVEKCLVGVILLVGDIAGPDIPDVPPEKKEHRHAKDFEPEIRAAKRKFEELQDDLRSQLDYKLDDIRDFNQHYNDELDKAIRALHLYGRTYMRIVPDMQDIWELMSDHQTASKIADFTDDVLAAIQAAEGVASIGKAVLEDGAAIGGKVERTAETAIEDTRCVTDPVDVVTGEVCVAASDFLLPGLLPLEFRRVYASASRDSGSLGTHWSHSWSRRVHRAEDGSVQYFAGDGRIVTFAIDAGAATGWMRHPRARDLSIREIEGGFEVRDRGPLSWRFTERRGDEWLLTSLFDANANEARFRYEDGALRRIDHSAGFHLRVEGAHRITRIEFVAANGAAHPLVRFTYDAAGRLNGVDNGTGLLLRYEYDDAGRLTRWADRQSTWFEYSYDGAGRCIEATGPQGLFHNTLSYDPERRCTRVSDDAGGVSVFQYDARNNIVATTDELGGTWTTAWDDHGSKLAETDAEGRTSRYEYDARGNLAVVTYPDGTSITVTYDDHDRPLLVVDASGRRWIRAYDARGRITAAGLDGRSLWHYAYDANGNIATVIHPDGASRRLSYDARGLRVSESDWNGNVTRYSRDDLGRVTAETDAMGNRTEYAYDARGNVTIVVLPTGARFESVYDVEGNTVRRVRPDGAVYEYRYGPFDLLQSVTRPSGGTIKYHYDGQARVARVDNEQGERWTFSYDVAGRLVEERDFSGRVTRLEYDRSGLCVRRISNGGTAHQLRRDAAGRVIEKLSADGERTRFEFDRDGRVKAATNDTIAVRFDRDDYGRIVREHQGDHVVESVYDQRGNRVRRLIDGAADASWSYDPNGRATRIESGGFWRVIARDAIGRDVEHRMRGGIVVRNEYDPLSRLVTQLAALESTTAPPIARREYAYDTNDNPVRIADSAWKDLRLDFDQDGRIIALHDDTGLVDAFSYNAAGSLLQTLAGDVRVLERGGRVQKAGNTHFSYDDDGRLVSRSNGADRWRFRWDSSDRLQSVLTPAAGEWEYRYDAFGRRVQKRGPTESTTYIWDGDVIAREQRMSNGATSRTEWVFEPRTFRPSITLQDGRAYACLTDHLGTPRELIADDGTRAWSSRLSVWGVVAHEERITADCDIRFAGQWYDRETGLHYNRFRYYDPTTGDYLSPDPIGLTGGTRLYGYVQNPTAWTDPFGLEGCKKLTNLETKVGADKTFAQNEAGQTYRSGNSPANDPAGFTGDVQQRAQELKNMDLQVPYNGPPTNTSLDNGIPGSSACSHAELKPIIADGRDYARVSKPPCAHCQDLIGAEAQARGSPIVLDSIEGGGLRFRFHPTGTQSHMPIPGE